MLKKSNTFNDFNKLLLKGQQILLTFGEYSNKTAGTSSKLKRRKIIKYFYKKIWTLIYLFK